MPCSSTRSTMIELSLVSFYRQTMVRLGGANMSNETHNITFMFAEALDMDSFDLHASLKPTYHPDHNSLASYKTDIKQWDDLVTSNRRMRRSAKICSAGNALADVGAALFTVGRNAEAARFCEWGNWFWQVSISQYNFEEKCESGGWNGDSDVEMGDEIHSTVIAEG